MDTPKRDKEKGLTIGLVAIIIAIVILALIGFFLLEPRTEKSRSYPNTHIR